MKELEDLTWFPPLLRNFQTDFIGFVVTRFKFYDRFIRYLKSISIQQQPMFDLGSGSGEPAITIFRESDCFSQLILSDKYPQLLTFAHPKISYLSQSMDVNEMEFQPGICYTMFNVFHHFSDKEKLQIVNRMNASGSVAFFVEILEPRFDTFLKVIFTTTVGNLLMAPFIKPFSLLRLFFTYIIPINILTITYDGVISVFKSRSVTQYQRLFSMYQNSVKVFKLKNPISPVVVIQVQPGK